MPCLVIVNFVKNGAYGNKVCTRAKSTIMTTIAKNGCFVECILWKNSSVCVDS